MSSDPGLNPSPPGSSFSLAAFEHQLIDVRFVPLADICDATSGVR